MEVHFLLLCLFVSGSYADCYFQCSDGKCIPYHYMCDNYDDCPNSEDEKHCYGTGAMSTTAVPCKEGEITCASGKCIPTAWVCDSHPDCRGGDDEDNCTLVQDHSTLDGPVLLALNSPSNASCTSVQFFCDNGTCIPNAWVCDSYSDCQSGEDEAQCPSTVKPNDFPSCDMTLCSACFSKTTAGPSGCPRDFVELNDTCLLMNALARPWEIANNVCRHRDSELVELVSYSEQKLDMLLTLLDKQSTFGLNFWIDGSGNQTDIPERQLDELVLGKENYLTVTWSASHSSECHYFNRALAQVFRSPDCDGSAVFICEWNDPESLE